MLADNPAGLWSCDDLENLINNVNNELNIIPRWSGLTKMAIKVEKTKLKIFHNKGYKKRM
jgi:hypothetical protein